MKIPKIINKDNRIYKYIKTYPNYYLYEDIQTKTKIAFQAFDLGLVEAKVVRPKLRKNMNMKA